MEKAKKILMLASLVFIALCLGASVWLYIVLRDTMSMVMMCIFFVALVWYGFNVRSMWRKEE
jgi:hypothetical protein